LKGEAVVEVSVTRRTNIGLLEKKLADMIWTGDVRPGEGAMVTNARHRELIKSAISHMKRSCTALNRRLSPELVAIDFKDAIRDLGLIIGKSVSDDILDRIFSKFCIGK
jgi:tRNA modification GTPase